MIDSSNFNALNGATVLDNDGDKIGSVGQIYVDPTTGNAAWLTVRTGLFGTGESFVPATGATWDNENVHVEYAKDFVKDAPRVDADGEIDQSETDALYTYYGFASVTDSAGHDTDRSGSASDDAMTRSEEHLRVGTERVETGRARLRKYVVTEQEAVTVPVTHEEVRVVTEPITDANAGDALNGPEITEQDHEVVLTGDRVVADTVAEPVERVRLDTDTVTEEQEVTGSVRKERIELDDDDGSGPSPRI